MAKPEQRKKAEILYIKEGKTAKEIAKILTVTEKTIGRWIKDGNWRLRRNARVSSYQTAEENVIKLGNIYAEKLLALASENPGDDLNEAERISKEENGLVDKLAKLNKYRESFEKNNRIPYNVYINVSETIMNDALEKLPNNLHTEILDFFEEHINNAALNYK